MPQMSVHAYAEERTSVHKNYYAAKLKLLERIVIAKEMKIALMEAKYNSKFNY